MRDLSENEGYFMATAAYRERVLEVCAESGNVNGSAVRPESRCTEYPVTVRRGPGGVLGVMPSQVVQPGDGCGLPDR